MSNGIQPSRGNDSQHISPAFQEKIDTIKGQGGKKNKIDTQEEYNQLAALLSASDGASKAEKGFIQGLMLEYDTEQVKDDAKRAAAEVTPAAREAVKNIKKIMPDKKELNEVEANMLLKLIRNTNEDFNAADIEYFKQELIKAGYGSLLETDALGSAVNVEEEYIPAEDVSEVPVTESAPDRLKEEATPSEIEKPAEDVPNKPEPHPSWPNPFEEGLGAADEPEKAVPERPKEVVTPPEIEEEPAVPDSEAELIEQTELTDEEKQELQKRGGFAARALNGYTTNSDQELVRGYINDLTSETVVEFLRGYADEKVKPFFQPSVVKAVQVLSKSDKRNPFFQQLMTEYGYPGKEEIASNVAQKLADYLQAHPSEENNKNATIIKGIIASGQFNRQDCKNLDNIVKAILTAET